MYSDKKNVLQLSALLLSHGVSKVVICPGTGHAALSHTLVSNNAFTCYAITDIRSAGFFALGLALSGGHPAAICCSSDASMLSLYPAVAQARAQQVPMVILSMGQRAIAEESSFGFYNTVKQTVMIPQVETDEDEWECNRLINMALLSMCTGCKGPVRIHLQTLPPLYQFNVDKFPQARVITHVSGYDLYNNHFPDLITKLSLYQRKMVLVGQMNMIYLFDKRLAKLLYKHFVWLCEHTSNRTVPGIPIKNFNLALATLPQEKLRQMTPQLLVTYGGQVLSERMRDFLALNPPKEHWHVSVNGEVTDPYHTLTTVIEMDPFDFLERIAPFLDNSVPTYPNLWVTYCAGVKAPVFPYSGMMAVSELFKSLPHECAVHLSGGSVICYAGLYDLPATVEVCSNLTGENVEGALSTAVGYAAQSDKLNFILIGDLAFFTDLTALWNTHIGNNVRILLLNNGGLGHAHNVAGLEMSGTSHHYITATHNNSAKSWAHERGLDYLRVESEQDLIEHLPVFTNPQPIQQPLLMEVFTNKNKDARLLKGFFSSFGKET